VENIALIVLLAPLAIVLVFMWLRYAREGKWLVALAQDWHDVLKRKSPPDDQQK
jgi:hypothetical protein